MVTPLPARKPPQEIFSRRGPARRRNVAATARRVRENRLALRRRTSVSPVFANGAVTGAFSYALSSVGSRSGGRETAQTEPGESSIFTGEEIMVASNGDLRGILGSESPDSFAMCVADCLESNYGGLYDAASAVSPLSAVSAGYEVLSRGLDAHGRRIATGNLYGDSPNLPRGRSFGTGVRQMRTLSQFSRFNAGMAVIGVGALGFQAGAQAYCRVSCIGQ